MAKFLGRTGFWLTASLALNVFLAGLWIGGFVGDSGEAPFEARFRSAPAVFSAQGILFALPEASREEARDILDAKSAQIRASIEDLRDARRAVAAAMARDPLDQVATDAALVELRGRTETVQSVLHGIVLEIAKDLNRQGITVVVVTHDPDIARHAKRIVSFRDGRGLSDEPVADRADARTELANLVDAAAREAAQ